MDNNLWSPYIFSESTIPSSVCDEIVNQYKERSFTEASIDKGHINNIRKSNIIFADEYWINAILYGYVTFANHSNFNYELTDFDKETFQFTRYGKGDYYGLHRDFCPERDRVSYTRKLSITVQLSDSDEYEGGDFVIDMSAYDGDFTNRKKSHTMTRRKGSIIVFDSRTPHEITPVTNGIRYSLVKWVHGDTPLR